MFRKNRNQNLSSPRCRRFLVVVSHGLVASLLSVVFYLFFFFKPFLLFCVCIENSSHSTFNENSRLIVKKLRQFDAKLKRTN